MRDRSLARPMLTPEQVCEATGLLKDKIHSVFRCCRIGLRTHRFFPEEIDIFLSEGADGVARFLKELDEERAQERRLKEEEIAAQLAREAAIASGWVYFIEAVGIDRIKIGWTTRGISDRLGALQTACPCDLLLLGAVRGSPMTERDLHARFSVSRVRGEWFQKTEELMGYINSKARLQ